MQRLLVSEDMCNLVAFTAACLIALLVLPGTVGMVLSNLEQGLKAIPSGQSQYVAGVQTSITLTVSVRDAAGRPAVGVGVRLYSVSYETGPVLEADQVAGESGEVSFDVRPNGSYSVALYAPPGSPWEFIPEDQQHLLGMGEMGMGGQIGIGIQMAAQDYVLRLVVQDDQPYHDRASSDEEAPDPFIPGVTDEGWPTPTPYAISGLTGPQETVVPSVPTAPPTASTAQGVPGAETTGTPPLEPAPFPWLPVIILAVIIAGIWGGYHLYAQGQLSMRHLSQQVRDLRRRRKKSSDEEKAAREGRRNV